MSKKIFAIGLMVFVVHISWAIGADPNSRQMQPRQMVPPRGTTTPQMQLTPDFLYQQITSLKQENAALNQQVPMLNGQVNTLKKQNASLSQQIQILTGQVNALRSVVQISANGATIQAENLSLTAGKALTISSGKETNLTAGEDLDLQSGKTLALKGGKDVTAEGAAQLKLKAPLIKLNNGTKGIALQNSPVSNGKVLSGSTTVFAK